VSDYSGELREQLIINIICGDYRKELTELLLTNGLGEETAQDEINRLARDPGISAARRLIKRAEKVEAFLDIQNQLFRKSGFISEFGTRQRLSGGEFYTKYFFRNLPVVVAGWMDDWPALKTWSPRNFADRFGDVEIEVVAGRNNDPQYEQNYERLCQKMLLKDFVKVIETKGTTNDIYLTARNRFLSRPEVAELLDEFSCPPGVLDHGLRGSGYTELWLGAAGTVSPLHHDACNILFAQVHGRKQVKLIPPHDIAKVYNERGVFSAVDLDAMDFERFPLLKEATVLDVTLNPGEFLFLPIGWWHWVKALDPSISLSFQNLFHESPNILWEPHLKRVKQW
jgi:hypothetical protein